MNHYLAKSNGETIVEHTRNLMKNYKILKELYPDISVNWELLRLACLYHDLGKMSAKFQEKLKTGQKMVEGEIPHGLLSTAFIPVKELKQEFSQEEISVLAYAVAKHHERNLVVYEDRYGKEVELVKKEVENFPSEDLGISDLTVRKISKKYYSIGTSLGTSDDRDAYRQYVMVKGLLNRIDYAASAYSQVEYPNDFLVKGMENLAYNWNPLQEYMLDHQSENVVVVAQTGIGKTEAGLLWLGNEKGFFTLPLKTAINAIYRRILEQIIVEKVETRLGLLHSETFSQYLSQTGLHSPEEIDEYQTRTSQWALPLTICTLDQIFNFVFIYGGYEQKLATLSYSKVIIDEIQMYSADLLAYLIKGLAYITQYGGKFSILTATLPPFITDLIRRRGITLPEKIPTFVDERLPLRHYIQVEQKELNYDSIQPFLFPNKKILIICNTVKRAKEIFIALQENFPQELLYLFHSQFIQQDRKEKEERILAFGNKKNKESGIWVTTQVVEAFLDIDFDILLTELTDLNGLFQRMGRCYRKRPLETETEANVYVFDGGEKRCSGVPYVIDKSLFQMSKEVLRTLGGPITEEEKMQLIETTYTTAKVEGTAYHDEIVSNLNYLDSLLEGEKNKSEVVKMFRNIHSLSVIPKPIYLENQTLITDLVKKLQEPTASYLSEEEKKIHMLEKKRARVDLNQFQVSLTVYEYDKKKFDEETSQVIEINRRESIPILDCLYTKEEGVTRKEVQQEDYFF